MFLNGASKKHRKLQGLSWERGDPGVGTLRSAAGAARHVAGARILGCMLLGVEVMSSMILSLKGAAQEARAKREREHGRGKVCETRLVRVEICWVNTEIRKPV